MSSSRLNILGILLGIFIGLFILFGPMLLSKEKPAAVRTISVARIVAELETVIANDILETRRGGFLVVDSHFNLIRYHKLGSPATENASANELARMVVRVYRVDTPEWTKLIADISKVSAELSKR
jgi:hypothetical protein